MMNKERRLLASVSWWSVVLLLVPMVLAACGGSGGEPVKVAFATSEFEIPMYEVLAAEFMAENSDIAIMLVPLEDLLQSTGAGEDSSSVLRRAVSGADCASSAIVMPQDLDSNLLLNLEPLLDADPNVSRDDFVPGVLDSTEDGFRILPHSVSVQTLSYNKDLFEANGLPLPEPGWSWEELFQTAEQLATRQGTRTYGMVDLMGGWTTFQVLLELHDINLHTQPMEEVRLDMPEIAEVLERMRTLVQSGAIHRQLPPGEDGAIPSDPITLIQEGQVGMWDKTFAMVSQASRGTASGLSVPFEVGTVPYPSSDLPMFANTSGFIISSGTRQPEAAWRWIEFLTRQNLNEGQMLQMASSHIIPARQSLAAQTGYWDSLDDETAAAYRWTLENHVLFSDLNIANVALNELSNAMFRVIGDEEADIDEVLAQSQRSLEQQLAEAAREPTLPSDTAPVSVDTPVPQDAPEGATTITFTSMDYSPSDLRQVAQRFHEQQSEVFVEVLPGMMGVGPVDLISLAQKSDCFAASLPVRNDDEAAVLVDLQPFLDERGKLAADYPSALLASYRHNGQLFGLPFSFNMRTLNYHEEAFAGAGIEPPDASWTLDDFLAAAQAVADGSGEGLQYGYVPAGMPFDDFFFFIRQSGASLTMGSGDNIQPNFDDPEVVDAIQWYLDLSREHGIMPDVRFPHRRDDVYDSSAFDLIQNGQAGMWFDYGYGMFTPASPDGSIGEIPERDFQIGIAPLPIAQAGLSGLDVGFSTAFSISRGAEDPQACWQWLEFLSGDVSLVKWGMPARFSVAQSEAFLQQSPSHMAEVQQVYQRTFEQFEESDLPFTPVPPFPETYWLFEAINAASEEGTDLKAALTEAQAMTTRFQACIEGGGTRLDCAEQVDPNNRGYFAE